VTKVADLLGQARQCFERGDLSRAETLCRQMLRLQPANPEGQFLLGLVCQRARRLDEALRCFEKVHRVRPGSGEVHYARGGVLQEQGKLEAAAAAFREALRLRPDLIAVHSSLGLVLLAQGKTAEAETCCRRVLRACPQVPEAHAHLAGALQAQGKLDEAIAAYHEALRLSPEFAAARNNLGQLFLAHGRKGEAADCFAEVLRTHPNFAEAHYNLGTIWQELGQFGQALACYREAIRLQPDFAPAHNALGMVYIQEEQRQDAADCFQHVLRLDPNQPLAHANLGTYLLEEGRREEATARFKEALRHDPNCVQALAAVMHFGLFSLDDAELARIEALLANPGLTPNEASQLHFGLGNLHDRAGAWEAAFTHIDRANALRRGLLQEAGQAFHPGLHRALVDQTIATCDASYFERVKGFGSDTQRPVFIVGMPRSGTSLVEQILGSHPDVFGAGELRDMFQLTAGLPSRLGTAEGYPTCLNRLDAGTTRIVADVYLQQLSLRNGSAARVTDKMPSNFEHLGFIATLFPRAYIIHCRREPLDVCLSCFFQDFQHVNFAYALEDLGHYYLEYERLMAHWRAVLPIPMLDVDYEEMVNDPETISRRLLAFCRLAWDDRCLEYHRTKRAVRTSSLLQVRQPVYKSSLGRWRHYETHLRPLREILEGKTPPPVPEVSGQPGSTTVRAAPALARTYARLADQLIQDGRSDEAATQYREALGHDPQCIAALAAVAWHGLFPLTNAELQRMEALLADPALPPGEAARLHFGLAHVHDRAGAYDSAFQHFSEANTLRRRLLQQAGKAFDPAFYETWIDEVIAACDAAYFAQVKGLGRDSEQPAFIVGMPRSGTTLVEQILASHPEVRGAGELLEMGRLMSGLMDGLPAGQHYPRRERLNRSVCTALADRYLQRLQAVGGTARRITDKTPNNFQFLGLIAALLPGARVIHCTRDPVDVCFSCFVQDFTEWTLSLEELAIYHRAYERLMAHWRSVLPLPLVEVAYEDLVSDPEAVSRRLVAFCGLEWDDRCLAFHENPREVRTASVLQVRQPVYQRSVGRWRNYEKHLRPLMDRLGRPTTD
jgi:tetratricopeptide (TPR) repeat protein